MHNADSLYRLTTAFQMTSIEADEFLALLDGKAWDNCVSTPAMLELTEPLPDGGRSVKPRVVQYLSNAASIPNKPYLSMYYPSLGTGYLVFRREETEPIERLILHSMRPGNSSSHFVCIHGQKGCGRRSALRYIACGNNFNLLRVDFTSITEHLEEILPELKLESLLMGAVVCFEDFTGDTDMLKSIAAGLYPATGLVLFTSEKPLPFLDRDSLYIMNAPAPQCTQERMRRIWTALSASFPLADNMDIHPEILSFTPGQIKQALHMAFTAAVSLDSSVIHRRNIDKSFRELRMEALAELGDIVEPVFTWDDLVLPNTAKDMLKAASERVKHKATVYEQWGYREKMPYGTGLHILLAGSPGTGKTMAASILSGELNLPLLRIDLSSVMSKYIGETEKKLGTIFDAAEKEDCIIFFDEADSLFGKRTETKDSHDRYANIQVSYLLQKIEQHKGVTILATNLIKNFDEAFQRRFHFIINFPPPGIAEKKLLWQKSFPASAPLDREIDYDYLAETFVLTGGNIKNIALSSAFYAASGNESIQMKHILQAIRDEYAKIGMPFPATATLMI